MRMLDLFSGIGGFSLAASWVWGYKLKILSFCESDAYCRKVLGKHWPYVKIISDIRRFREYQFEAVDLLTGGPPCQPASCAGKREGCKDNRWLWPEALKAVEHAKPRWVLLENPTGILSLNNGMEFEGICSALEGMGYWVENFVIPASAVGAWHKRNRIWIVANTNRIGCKGMASSECGQKSRGTLSCDGNIQIATNTDSTRLSVREMLTGVHEETNSENSGSPWITHWLEAVVKFCGVADGLPERLDPHRRDRIKALGNAIVPQVAAQIMMAIKQADENDNSEYLARLGTNWSSE